MTHKPDKKDVLFFAATKQLHEAFILLLSVFLLHNAPRTQTKSHKNKDPRRGNCFFFGAPKQLHMQIILNRTIVQPKRKPHTTTSWETTSQTEGSFFVLGPHNSFLGRSCLITRCSTQKASCTQEFFLGFPETVAYGVCSCR
jgi:hypothetical protein